MKNKINLFKWLIIGVAIPFILILCFLVWVKIHRAKNLEGTVKTMTWDGLERKYIVYIPSNSKKDKPVPLLLVLHGGGGKAEGMPRLTFGKFNLLAHEEGFIVVYPEGIDKHWNDGRGLEDRKAQRENVDDVGFLSAIIDEMIKDQNVDPTRVYSTGISNGGLMSYRLALDRSDKISAIAPVVASMGEDIAQNSPPPTNPVSVMIINGTQDPLVPFNGGEIHLFRKKMGRVISTADTVKYWIKHNKCEETPHSSYLADNNPDDGSRVKVDIYKNGQQETEVVLYTVEGGGHTWPGGMQYQLESVVGKTNRDFNACEHIWNFLKKHHR